MNEQKEIILAKGKVSLDSFGGGLKIGNIWFFDIMKESFKELKGKTITLKAVIEDEDK